MVEVSVIREKEVRGIFYLFFQDWVELSFPSTKCPFSDFIASCNQGTRILYVVYGKWWIKKWKEGRKKRLFTNMVYQAFKPYYDYRES